MRLVLPMPPSPRDWPKHHYALHRAKNAYRQACWARAIQQHPPRHEADLPELVLVSAEFVSPDRRGERDGDNLVTSLKWVLDCLKARQTGKLAWRQGAYDEKGYLIDDDPQRMQLAEVSQTVDRTAPEAVLVLTLTSEG